MNELQYATIQVNFRTNTILSEKKSRYIRNYILIKPRNKTKQKLNNKQCIV